MSERIDLNNFKVITDKLNTYFKNNQFMVGSSIPNVGTYKVGDIIVNNGNNATEIPMWICTEAGTPGTWEVFNSGGMEETELENYITNIVQSQAISAVDYTDGMDIQIDGKDYSSDIGQLNDLCTTNKDNLVGAINELFQNANNGKELIANAIGEPLNSEDTFNAMSTDINSLLSTFKANMMNAGVVVESGDKFKSLIEKIKGLTEGEGNKDLQCATGICELTTRLVANYSGTRTVSKNILSTNDIGFVPTYLFMKLPGCQFRYNPSNITTVYTLATWIKVNEQIKGEGGYIEVNYTTEEGAIIKVVSSSSGYEITLQGGTIEWYAIGVGEEDTTLRDSLADILENKGVDVTEDDDMASLITKVETMKSGGGYNIEVVSELPTKADNYQIAIVDSNPDAHIYIDTIESSAALNTYAFNDGDIYVRNITSIDVPGVHRAKILTQNLTKSYTIQSILKYNSGSFSYLGDSVYEYLDNKWNLIFGNNLNIYRDGVLVNDVTFGKYGGNANNTSCITTVTAEQYQITLNKNSNTYIGFSTNVPIDVTNYNKLVFDLKSQTSSSVAGTFNIGVCKNQGATSCDKYITLDMTGMSGTGVYPSPGIYTIDISDLTGSYYLAITSSYNHSCNTLKFNFSAIYLTI